MAAGFELLYLAMFIVGFTGSGMLVWWTRRRSQQRQRLQEVVVGDTPRKFEALETPVPQSSRPTADYPALESDVLGTQPPIAQLLFTARKDVGDRECPKCKRRFGETAVLCPFDSTALRPVGLRHKRTTRPAVTGSRRPTCSSCGRRYESAAKFCYNDGKPLSDNSPDEVPIVRVCRACGFEAMDSRSTCTCEEPDFMEIDPSRSQIMMPTVPMMHCRRCDHVADGAQTHCPNDGELLYPVMNVSMNALPPTGIGPRRKVCEKCGRKFSSAAHYCAYDGSTLKHLN